MSLLTIFGSLHTCYSQSNDLEETERKCNVEYSFDLVEGKMVAHFGRWATPVDTLASQDLCLEDWKKLKNTEPNNPEKKLSNYFITENLGLLNGAELSGYLELDFSDNGDLFILDVHKKKVFVYNQNLKLKDSFGSENEFKNVSDIIVNDGKVYITDPYLQKMTVFSEDGKILKTFDLNNQAVDMVIINDNICTHTAGAIPADGTVITCYDYRSGERSFNFLEPSEEISRIPWGISNVTISAIQSYKNKIITVDHPLEAVVRIFDDKGKQISVFNIENEVYKLPEIPVDYNVLQNLPYHYVQTLIHGIHVFDEKIMLLFIEIETGTKYVDFYNFDGERLIEKVIDIGKRWPIHNDKDGNLYAFSYTDDEKGINLKKYKYVGDL